MATEGATGASKAPLSFSLPKKRKMPGLEDEEPSSLPVDQAEILAALCSRPADPNGRLLSRSSSTRPSEEGTLVSGSQEPPESFLQAFDNNGAAAGSADALQRYGVVRTSWPDRPRPFMPVRTCHQQSSSSQPVRTCQQQSLSSQEIRPQQLVLQISGRRRKVHFANVPSGFSDVADLEEKETCQLPPRQQRRLAELCSRPVDRDETFELEATEQEAKTCGKQAERRGRGKGKGKGKRRRDTGAKSDDKHRPNIFQIFNKIFEAAGRGTDESPDHRHLGDFQADRWPGPNDKLHRAWLRLVDDAWSDVAHHELHELALRGSLLQEMPTIKSLVTTSDSTSEVRPSPGSMMNSTPGSMGTKTPNPGSLPSNAPNWSPTLSAASAGSPGSSPDSPVEPATCPAGSSELASKSPPLQPASKSPPSQPASNSPPSDPLSENRTPPSQLASKSPPSDPLSENRTPPSQPASKSPPSDPLSENRTPPSQPASMSLASVGEPASKVSDSSGQPSSKPTPASKSTARLREYVTRSTASLGELPDRSPKEKQQDFQQGTLVSVTLGLEGEATGRCERWDESTGRWTVRLASGSKYGIKPKDLTIKAQDQLQEKAAKITGMQDPGSVQNINDQEKDRTKSTSSQDHCSMQNVHEQAKEWKVGDEVQFNSKRYQRWIASRVTNVVRSHETGEVEYYELRDKPKVLPQDVIPVDKRASRSNTV